MADILNIRFTGRKNRWKWKLKIIAKNLKAEMCLIMYRTNLKVEIYMVCMAGKVLHKEISFPKDMGVIIENMELMPQYDAYDNLKILGKIRKTATDDDINSTLEKVGLHDVKGKKVRTYSLGMKQKLAIAQAIFEHPKLLLLDEPTNALDEESINDIRKLLLELKEKGVLIIVASHNKEDIELLSDVKINMADGKIKSEVRK